MVTEDRNAGELAAIRYRCLAKGIGDLYGRPRRGWKTRTARRLGVDQSYLNRILDGSVKGIGLELIEKAVERVPIRRAFFTDWAPGQDPQALEWGAYVDTGHSDPAPHAWESARRRAERFMKGARAGKPSGRDARAVASAVLQDPVVSAALDVERARDDAAATQSAFKLVALLQRPAGADAVDLRREEVEPPRLRVRRPMGSRGGLPWPGAPGRFVGLRKVRQDESPDPDQIVLEVPHEGAPGGVSSRYVDAGPVEVPDSPYFRRAIDRGDLEVVVEGSARTRAKKPTRRQHK